MRFFTEGTEIKESPRVKLYSVSLGDVLEIKDIESGVTIRIEAERILDEFKKELDEGTWRER